MKKESKKIEIVWQPYETTPEEAERRLNRAFDLLFEMTLKDQLQSKKN